MKDSLFATAYYALRYQGYSMEEIIKSLEIDGKPDDINRGICEGYEICTATVIAKMKEKESNKKFILNGIASLQQDFDDCDYYHGQIFMEIEKRKLENLSMKELFELEARVMEMKDKKMDEMIKYKNFLRED